MSKMNYHQIVHFMATVINRASSLTPSFMPFFTNEVPDVIRDTKTYTGCAWDTEGVKVEVFHPIDEIERGHIFVSIKTSEGEWKELNVQGLGVEEALHAIQLFLQEDRRFQHYGSSL